MCFRPPTAKKITEPCPQCTTAKDPIVVCPNCGFVPEFPCPKCGANNLVTNQQCINCGYKAPKMPPPPGMSAAGTAVKMPPPPGQSGGMVPPKAPPAPPKKPGA
jgi:hypothetical protein